MSVLIKGMEMPKNCLNCAVVQYDDEESEYYCPFSNNIAFRDSRRASCPLVEVPPHGRLIDGDELKTAFPRCDNSMNIKIASVRATINHASTIIEAEGET